MKDVIGHRLGRYEITGRVGAGGMGEVFRARDAVLGREVAVKVLAKDATDHPGRLERFEREAQAVARLSHPNILEIFDFGIEGQVSYAVTELLRGRTLRERLLRGALPLKKAVEVGRDIAQGLAAAHDQGVIHRDLKPSNIFLTDSGQVKILDFGLARLRDLESESSRSEGSTEPLTDAGRVVGTVGYMSPEQVEGRAIDVRSDIFSLGCVLYELLTGQRAFHEATASDTMLAILGRDPRPIRELRDDVSPAVELVVHRCLEKQPGERFESARDVAFALEALSDGRDSSSGIREARRRPGRRRVLLAALAMLALAVLVSVSILRNLAPPPPFPDELRLAVLRFTTVASGGAEDLVAAGLAEKLAGDLRLLEEAQQGSLWVLPAGMSGGRDPDVLAASAGKYGLTLGIGGRLERHTETIRLELELIEPETGRRLRSRVFEDGAANLDALQRGPLLEVAELLGQPVPDSVVRRVEGESTNVGSALEGYLVGLGQLVVERGGGEVGDAAVKSLEAAIRADPAFVPAHLALARAAVGRLAATDDEGWLEAGLAEVREAARLGSPPGEAAALEAELLAAVGRHEDALVALRQAVRERPASAELHQDLGRLLQRLGRFDEAESELERAVYLRPGYWVTHHWLARMYLGAGAYEAAAVQFRHVIDCAPRYSGGYNNLGFVLHKLERPTAAREVFERSLTIQPEGNYNAVLNLGTLYFEGSRFDDAARMFEKALEIDPEDYLSWGNLAFSYQSTGREPERAQSAFARAAELAEAELERDPDEVSVRCKLAIYYAALGRRDDGLAELERVVVGDPRDPQLIADIADAYEDLDERERALEWVERAFAAGVPPSRFENRPSLRDLVADERYRRLIRAADPA